MRDSLSSSCSQVVLVYLRPCILSQFIHEMCVEVKIAKNTKPLNFGGLGSFKVIDVGTVKKFVTSACYVKQHVCGEYLQQFSR